MKKSAAYLSFLIAIAVCALFYVFFSTQQSPKLAPVTEQKAFVILVPSYNNSPWVEKNLLSILAQDYENYRAIYIDDNSTDDTLARVKGCTAQYDNKQKIDIWENKANRGTLLNLYNAAQFCHDHEILVFLHGDDFFAHEHVLTALNEAYANPDTWLTFGGGLDYPTYKESIQHKKSSYTQMAKIIKLRKTPYAPVHLLSCYKALFKQLPLQELFHQGQLFPMGASYALFYPLTELAGNHTQYINRPLYLKNQLNQIGEKQVFPQYREECIAIMRARLALDPLPSLLPSPSQANTADLLVFSEDNPLQLESFLHQIQDSVVGVNKIWILYQASTTDFASGYLELKIAFPQLQFLAKKTETLLQLLNNHSLPYSDYVILAQDTTIFKEKITLSPVIEQLKTTGALAYYFSYHPQLCFCASLSRPQPLPPSICIDHPFGSFHAWQFDSGMDDWSCRQNTCFTLYRKKDLVQMAQNRDTSSFEELFEEWGQKLDQNALGLYPTRPSCFSLELSQTPKEKLKFFYAGMTPDLKTIKTLSTNAQSIEAKVPFITHGE